jgi:L-threonylcarbamoyladenylate synthase
MKKTKSLTKGVAALLRAGGIAVIPTDTLYGIVAPACDKDAVSRLYAVRRRAPHKPFIILIGSLDDIGRCGARVTPRMARVLASLWPGPLSLLLPCRSGKFSYLHRGTNELAFRMPKGAALRRFLRQTGPLVAPSANFEGGKPAHTIREAHAYFGDEVGAYVDAGARDGAPSTLVRFGRCGIEIVREGAMPRAAIEKELENL